MRRREFITLVSGAATAWPLTARAQRPDRIARVGYLRLSPTARIQLFDDAFREGLRDLGYVEGRNIRIEYRSSEGTRIDSSHWQKNWLRSMSMSS
jgi:putative ABC transport system substrate-binding protein